MSTGNIAQLDAFLAVARCGGFRAAARDLDVSPSAISNAISALEQRLGVRLFNRTTRSVALTAAGEQYLGEVRPALDLIRIAGDRLNEHGTRPTGTLRLNTHLVAARTILRPVILEYMRRYPAVEVELVTEGALVDAVGKGFDAGIRLAEAVPPDMIAVPITRTMRSVIVGAPSYFADRPMPQMPDDLLSHRCIRARMASGRRYRWEFEKRGESVAIDVPGQLTLDEAGLMQEAAIAGEGLAILSEHLVEADLVAGRLIRVLDDWTPPYEGLCLYYPSRRLAPAKLRALVDLLRELKA